LVAVRIVLQDQTLELSVDAGTPEARIPAGPAKLG
jgi:hypothetical protein